MSRRSPDELVMVASAQNQADAEFVQNLLRAAGVPSVLRRSGGADVPDFLAAGRRDVLVPASMAEIARDALTPADPGAERVMSGPVPSRG
jgi:pimeloyl-ACP methyl ester carboxylesterase